MSAGEYVVVDGDSSEIQEAGFITPENVGKMKFTFLPGKDITESLAKKKQAEVSALKKGRTAYTPLTCVYPNGIDKSSKVILTNCIVQWRQGVDREDSNYCIDYVSLGIPSLYISSISSSAKKHSSINIGVKDGVQEKNNHYWVSCNLGNLKQENTWIIHQGEDGEGIGSQGILRNILKAMRKNLLVDVAVSISGSMATESLMEKLSLETGQYTFTIKPTEMFIKDITTIEGPILEDTNRREKETTEKASRFIASAVLAEYAMRNLKI